jgi:hypothetical protein
VGSDDGVEHSGILGFPILSIARYSKEHMKYATFRKLNLFPSSFGAVGDTYRAVSVRKS